MTDNRNYWGFRINVECKEKHPEYYERHLREGFLKQGWGWADEQNLERISQAGSVPRELKANLRMYSEVKAGDIILVPRTPKWEFVTIAEATMDWNKGYRFEIDPELKDYGHSFPARYVTHFTRTNDNVRGDIRRTLRCQSRFWNMSWCRESIDRLRERRPEELTSYQEPKDRFIGAAKHVLDNNKRLEEVHGELSKQFEGAGWERAFEAGLKALFPHYSVERTGGRGEEKHGTDILLTIPAPMKGISYGIAVQVKDWDDIALIEDAVEQVKKADDGWAGEGIRIIDKIIILTNAVVSDRTDLSKLSREGITVLQSDDLKRLTHRMAMAAVLASEEDK